MNISDSKQMVSEINDRDLPYKAIWIYPDRVAYVDAIDYEEMIKYTWRVSKQGGVYYPKRRPSPSRGETFMTDALGRAVWKEFNQTNSTDAVLYRDKDPLNCRRDNLFIKYIGLRNTPHKKKVKQILTVEEVIPEPVESKEIVPIVIMDKFNQLMECLHKLIDIAEKGKSIGLDVKEQIQALCNKITLVIGEM